MRNKTRLVLRRLPLKKGSRFFVPDFYRERKFCEDGSLKDKTEKGDKAGETVGDAEKTPGRLPGRRREKEKKDKKTRKPLWQEEDGAEKSRNGNRKVETQKKEGGALSKTEKLKGKHIKEKTKHRKRTKAPKGKTAAKRKQRHPGNGRKREKIGRAG